MKRTKCRQEKQKPVSVLDYNENMGGVDLKDQLLQPYLLERNKMIKGYIKLFRRLLNTTVLNCMVICCEKSGQPKQTILNSEQIWYRHCLLNMEVKVSGNFKAIIPRTKMCRDFLKDIFQKEYHRQKKRPGQQGGVQCYKNNRIKETVFGAPNVKQPYVLKNVSWHFTPS